MLYVFKGAKGIIWKTHDKSGALLPPDFAPWRLKGTEKTRD